MTFKNRNCLLLLEFGIPHYRYFIFEYFNSVFKEFEIFHSGERFSENNDFKNKKGVNIKFPNEISLTFFNPFLFFKYELIISTLNLRKPHTWLPIIFFPKKKWILWGQGVHKNESKLLNNFRRYIISKSIGYVTYTDKGRENLISMGVMPEKISVAYNTLRIDNSEMTIGKDYLLYVGRLQKRKGIEKVIKCIKNTKYKLLIIGDGDYKIYLKDLVKSYKLEEQVEFIQGIYDDNLLKKYFSNSIAYVSPDHVGLGVVHSFAYGVPVVTCRNRKHAPEFEYCNESNSYLYNDDNELLDTIKCIYTDDKMRLVKKENAFSFFNKNLHFENVYKAFIYQFKKIEI
jgi:glycosyltransferase involved in cell wall biosynthesis